jgi:OOP family OmpA-OmpF porin
MKKIMFATLISCVMAAPVVHAERNVYAGLALGAGKGEMTLYDGTTTIVSDENHIPFNGYVGYAFHPNFAVEGGITFFGEHHFNGSQTTAAFGIFHAAIKASTNLSDKWLLTGKVGVARHGLTVDTHRNPGNSTFAINATTPLLGVGTEYRFTDRISATLELNDYGSSDKPGMNVQVRNVEAGIKYRF